MQSGYYYLHKNGSLIYKPIGDPADFMESTFVQAFWYFVPGDRQNAWRILVEALAAGADRERVFGLAAKWGCDDDDAEEYGRRVGIQFRKNERGGWFALAFGRSDVIYTPGATKLEAMAALATEIGYRPLKMWGETFEQCLKHLAPGIETPKETT